MQPIKYRPGAVLALGQRSDRLVAAATALGTLALGAVAARNVLSRVANARAKAKELPEGRDHPGNALPVENVIVETMRVTVEVVEQRISRAHLR